MKTCSNCKYCEPLGTYEYYECRAPQNNVENLVVGGFKPRWQFCATHRPDSWLLALLIGTCGKRGRWFQAKEKP